MGQFESGKWILYLSAYFLFLILGLSVLQIAFDKTGLDYSFTTVGDTGLFDDIIKQTNGYYCSSPRTFYNPASAEYEEIGYFSQYSLNCKWSDGNADADRCTDIAGCTWVEASTIFFLFTTSAYCDGTINMSAYTPYTSQVTDIGKPKSSFHDPNTLYIIDLTETAQFINYDGKISNQVCELATNENSCNIMGCQWVSIADDDSSSGEASLGTILDITGSLFTFQASFTDDYFTDLALTILLFYLPLLAYLIAIYFALPFIH